MENFSGVTVAEADACGYLNVAAQDQLVAFIDKHCLIRSTTPAMARLLGYGQPQELIGHFYGHFFTVLDAGSQLQSSCKFPRDLDPVVRCLNSGEGCLNAAAFIPGTETGTHLFEGTVGPVYGPGHSLGGALLIGRNVSRTDPRP